MLTLIQSDLEKISEFDPGMWSQIQNKKIFATGCTGFIGQWIVRSFEYINRKYNLNSELILLTRDKRRHQKKFFGIKFIEGDIQNFHFSEEKINIDFVIHGATEVAAYQTGENSSSLLDVSFYGTNRVIDFAQRTGVQKILFLSSGAAYGTQPKELLQLDESFLGAPDVRNSRSTYGEAKRLAELLLFNQSIPATSARIFATYGPFISMDSNYAFSNFIDSMIKDEKITIKSNGKTTRSYLYIGDLVLWLWILLLKGKEREIYNVGSEDEISILDLAHQMRKILDKKTEVEVLGTENDFNRYIPSTKKIREEFQIKNLIPLEIGVRKTYEFLKDQYAISSK